ncbi:MAG: glutathione S-transferase family protein [Candidatus Binatus sp.]|uniref:glutathione S-transferase family protein n=1 Tax=Candidatus Binatus sp. TaxID=2811406 RepID=UPI0027277520|nr:glutathione S-transferase family protein [Candidatus Binatus sp.]MDO8434879.1 glutathione S-transferase family protein [Candidatus Binatus sp.]
MIKLYDYLICPYGQKVRIALAEKALSYELVTVDLRLNEHRKPDFLRLNLFGRVPVLVDDDTTVYDSTVINEYLEDEYPEPPLFPAIGMSAMRARARLLEDFADSSFTPQVGQLIVEVSKPEAERDQNRVQRLHQTVERVLDYLNHELRGNNFLAGDFSVADIGFAPRMLVLSELGIDVAANNRANIDAWLKRLLERASIRNLEGVAAEAVGGG